MYAEVDWQATGVVLATLVGVGGFVVGAVGLFFLASQVRMQTEQMKRDNERARDQMALANQQARIANDQARIANQQLEESRVTAEVNLNLGIMNRLDDVLLKISEDANEGDEGEKSSYAAIWSREPFTLPDNSKPHVLLVSLIDAIEMALMSCQRVPGFTNAEDWESYAFDCLTLSRPLNDEIRLHGEYWPYWNRFADLLKAENRFPPLDGETASDGVQRVSPTSVEGTRVEHGPPAESELSPEVSVAGEVGDIG
jgi:hypothetical protein